MFEKEKERERERDRGINVSEEPGVSHAWGTSGVNGFMAQI